MRLTARMKVLVAVLVVLDSCLIVSASVPPDNCPYPDYEVSPPSTYSVTQDDNTMQVTMTYSGFDIAELDFPLQLANDVCQLSAYVAGYNGWTPTYGADGCAVSWSKTMPYTTWAAHCASTVEGPAATTTTSKTVATTAQMITGKVGNKITYITIKEAPRVYKILLPNEVSVTLSFDVVESPIDDSDVELSGYAAYQEETNTIVFQLLAAVVYPYGWAYLEPKVTMQPQDVYDAMALAYQVTECNVYDFCYLPHIVTAIPFSGGDCGTHAEYMLSYHLDCRDNTQQDCDMETLHVSDLLQMKVSVKMDDCSSTSTQENVYLQAVMVDPATDKPVYTLAENTPYVAESTLVTDGAVPLGNSDVDWTLTKNYNDGRPPVTYAHVQKDPNFKPKIVIQDAMHTNLQLTFPPEYVDTNGNPWNLTCVWDINWEGKGRAANKPTTVIQSTNFYFDYSIPYVAISTSYDNNDDDNNNNNNGGKGSNTAVIVGTVCGVAAAVAVVAAVVGGAIYLKRKNAYISV